MKLYRKLIRPVHCYPGQHYEPLTEPVEKEEKWYPEEEREHLEKKYASYNEGSFSDLIFEEKYEPYDALELLTHNAPQIVRCKDCKYWQDNNGGYPNPECRWGHEETPDAEDYCSFGEVKQDAAVG